jgi:hypothetical protein
MIFLGALAIGFLVLVVYSVLMISGRLSDEEEHRDRKG